MALLRWQWLLANGGAIEAVIDTDAARETVSQEGRVLSDSPRGGKPDGHVVLATPNRADGMSARPPLEAVVTFDPTAPICILRVEGEEVAPRAWPTRERPNPAPPPRSVGSWVPMAIAGVALLAVGFGVRALRGAPPPEPLAGPLSGIHRSADGRFVAHFPVDLVPRGPALPAGAAGVILENKPKSIAIAIVSTTLDATSPRDPWAIQQTLREEVMANLPKGDGRYEEGARRDETCLGRPGAVVVGQILVRSARQARLWSCAFAHEETGYLVLSMMTEPVDGADERRVRAILDATELTRLGELGSAPSSP